MRAVDWTSLWGACATSHPHPFHRVDCVAVVLQHAAGDMEALVESRKRAAKQRAATNLFHATIRSKAHPLIRHCRRIMREQLRKREGVMRTEGIKITATAIEYGWVPDIIVCGKYLASAVPTASVAHWGGTVH